MTFIIQRSNQVKKGVGSDNRKTGTNRVLRDKTAQCRTILR